MRKTAWLCLLVLSAMLVFGQDRGKITVVIVNDQQAALENATVELLKSKDSTLVKAAVTDAAGIAEIIQVPWNNYIVRVSMVNFKPVYSAPFTISAETSELRLPAIVRQLQLCPSDEPEPSFLK